MSEYHKKIQKYSHKFFKLNGGVLENILIVCDKKNKTSDYKVFLNDKFEYCNFKLSKYTSDEVLYYLENTIIEGAAINPNTIELLRTTTKPIYYLSDFYTKLNHDDIISLTKSHSENQIILQDNLFLSDTNGIATISLKYVLNSITDTDSIILCLEPILGKREKSITYKNKHKTDLERYEELCNYYAKLGLTTFTNVFIILSLFYDIKNSSNEIDFVRDLHERKYINNTQPDRVYFETRKFIINKINIPYDIKHGITIKYYTIAKT